MTRSDRPEATHARAATEQTAINTAQTLILKQLPVPQSTVFGPATVTDEGNGLYGVTGWVDAEGLFGMLYRCQWRTEVRCQAGIWGVWSLESVPALPRETFRLH
jgi:hypothetical protein